MKLTDREQVVLRAVINFAFGARLVTNVTEMKEQRWYRAQGSGERVTLASLYRKGRLTRRAWRGREGEPDAAHEYRPAI